MVAASHSHNPPDDGQTDKGRLASGSLREWKEDVMRGERQDSRGSQLLETGNPYTRLPSDGQEHRESGKHGVRHE